MEGHASNPRLDHAQIQRLVQTLGEANVVDLDKTVRQLIEPIGAALKLDPQARVSLHILCCNEYALVTG
jgi:hypothetical protein